MGLEGFFPDYERGKDYGNYEFSFASTQGEKSIHVSQSTVKKNNIIVGRVFILMDITERKQAERALNEKTRELEELNKTLEERVTREVEKRRQQEQILIQQSKMAAMGEMISMIAHQWRQPLSSITTVSGELQINLELGNMDHKHFLSGLRSIDEQAQFLSRTVNDFRHFFRPNKKREETHIRDIIEQTVRIIGKSLEYKSIRLEKKITLEKKLVTYPNEIMQVFLNIIKNAQDAIVEQKTLSPRIEIAGYAEGDTQVVEITDNAGGIPHEHVAKVFEPYFTTKGVQTGTGLGLYMSKTIVEKHCKGTLTVENVTHEDGTQGACFRITLPKLPFNEEGTE